MIARPSLRWLVLVPTVLVICVGTVAVGVYIDRVQYLDRLADLDEELVRADRGSGRTGAPGSPPPPAASPAAPSDAGGDTAAQNTTADPDDEAALDEQVSDEVEVVTGIDPPIQLVIDRNGDIVSPGEPSPESEFLASAAIGRSGSFTLDPARLRVLVTPSGNSESRVTALRLDDIDADRADFRRALVVGIGSIVAIQTVVILLATSVAIRPVTRMARTARRVADGALDTEIEPAGGARETAELASDLDRMLVRLRSTIEHSEASAAEATAAREDMARFLADVSHEIRTPLTALRGYSDLYDQGMLDEPGAVDRAMGRVGDESRRLHGLVNDMMQLVRGATPRDATELLDVSPIVEVVAADLRSAHPGRTIALDIEPGCWIKAAPGDLHRAVLNLGSNACEHTADEVSVRLTVRCSESTVEVDVADDGAGIASDDLEKIFLPFYRVDRSRSRDGGGGAGLGLAIAKQLVEANSGRIEVDTAPGAGTSFRLSFEPAEPSG